MKTDKWLGNLCRGVKTKHLAWCFSHIKSAFLKSKLPKIHERCCIKNSWENKTQLSDFLSEFVIFLKLGVLWWELKIFIANFSHVSPNRFWRIFSMLLNSHSTIKRRWKNSVAISLILNHNLTGLKLPPPSLSSPATYSLGLSPCCSPPLLHQC